MTALKTVDQAALRANQAAIIGFCLLAYIFNWPWLAGFTALVMLAGTLVGKPGFSPIYRWVLKPIGLVKPDPIPDNPQPHRFAQGFGGVVLSIGTGAILFGSAVFGWALVWLVIALAALNLFAGFCLGCAMYYWLGKLHIPGFSKPPLEGVVPGMRPTGKDR
jgi:hypothetical protein